jgi:hypothetical protein
MDSRMTEFQNRLREATKNCRPDMHEPDNAGITAVVTGYHLDNAMGDDPYRNVGEFTVGISDDGGHNHEWFNLATLIALARMVEKGK